MCNDDDNMFFPPCQTITSKEKINDDEFLKIEDTYEVKNDFEKAKKKLDAKLKKSKSFLLSIVLKSFKRLQKIKKCEFCKIS